MSLTARLLFLIEDVGSRPNSNPCSYLQNYIRPHSEAHLPSTIIFIIFLILYSLYSRVLSTFPSDFSYFSCIPSSIFSCFFCSVRKITESRLVSITEVALESNVERTTCMYLCHEQDAGKYHNTKRMFKCFENVMKSKCMEFY
jgi:hypothetical protein